MSDAISIGRKGRSKVKALEKPLRSLSGATITTRPNGRKACASA